MFKKIIIGLSAGFISGLFTSGGGMIVVPAIMHIFKLNSAKSRATSIFIILPMVIISGFLYYKNNNLDWNLAIKCAVGGIAGGYLGAKLLSKFSNNLLRIMFIIFIIFVSFKMIR